jgi:hypothetical protein
MLTTPNVSKRVVSPSPSQASSCMGRGEVVVVVD